MAPVVAALRKRGCEVEEADRAEDYESVASVQYLYEPLLEATDIVLLLGDRHELLLFAHAATVARVPIAHIHGGETTVGSFDNQIRDAVTKLSHIHFVAAAPYFRKVVYGLGEDRSRVHIVGAPGLDNLINLPPRKPDKYFAVTYHPATLDDGSSVVALVGALQRFPDYQVMWTGVNNDPGSDKIRHALEKYAHVRILRPEQYIQLCRHAAAVVGNSSSGIIEAPTLEVPTVNVGTRQDGRLRGSSIFDCPEDADAIEEAIKQAIVYHGPYANPCGGPGASERIADILADIDLDGILVKRW